MLACAAIPHVYKRFMCSFNHPLAFIYDRTMMRHCSPAGVRASRAQVRSVSPGALRLLADAARARGQRGDGRTDLWTGNYSP